ncbi:hypothetical protein [Motilibacter aurantiacus]|uniref:hypothetical protein n=1 Tax=Motilibacter aurantiacus TaxID=2714955 RepID=UPI00140BC4AB|nr:hypothetical protein [Motilibacter aurantiacus]NHC44793.1 hypothetical protein [Motilibacter aurantiacus]
MAAPDRAARPVSRRTRAALTGVGVVVLLAAVGLVLSLAWDRGPSPDAVAAAGAPGAAAVQPTPSRAAAAATSPAASASASPTPGSARPGRAPAPAAATPAATTPATPAPTASSQPAPPRTAPSPASSLPGLAVRTPFWTVIVKSWRPAQDGPDRLRDVRRVRGLTPMVLWSSEFSSLRPGWWAVALGRYDDRAGAEKLLRRLDPRLSGSAYSRCIGTSAQCPRSPGAGATFMHNSLAGRLQHA